MLRFRSFIREQHLILENRIEKLKTIFKDKIDSSHDTHGVHKTSDDIIDHFSRHADPSRTKEHTQWIINRYGSKTKKDAFGNQIKIPGGFAQEDHPRIRRALSHFDEHRSKLPNKDLNSYKRLSDVEDAVAPHIDQPPVPSNNEKEKQLKKAGADLIHSGNGVTIHQLKDMNGACIYGRGTRWCTSGTEAKSKDIKGHIKEVHYENKDSQTPSHYTIENKEGMSEKVKAEDVHHDNLFHSPTYRNPPIIIQHAGRKYQFHNNSNQFMDEKNNSTDISAIHPDIQKEMLKSNHPEIHKANVIFKHPNATPEHISTALKDEHRDVRQQAIRHPKATPEHISTALKDEHPDVRYEAIRHPNATPEHISTALKDKESVIRSSARSHPLNKGGQK